jgi:delta-aminolevulinic acid dehydratase/porphobilinogen synthase
LAKYKNAAVPATLRLFTRIACAGSSPSSIARASSEAAEPPGYSFAGIKEANENKAAQKIHEMKKMSYSIKLHQSLYGPAETAADFQGKRTPEAPIPAEAARDAEEEGED